MIRRTIQDHIEKRLGSHKAIIIMGARQTGKTTLAEEMFGNQEDCLWLNGDEPDIRALFGNITSTRLKAVIGKKTRIVIDEAQRIENIGIKLKLITDSIPEVQLIATGSSSFELANRVNEPLTGRKWEYTLYPLSFEELVVEHGMINEKRLLPHRMVFGSYPEILTSPGDEKALLKLLSDSYLYKDILTWENIKHPDKLSTLLSALAYQIGSQVSYAEVGQICGLDPKTVEKYIALLEQAYIVFRLRSFSRNLRNELKASRKIYFWDNGIRNACISNFSQIESRADVGALWENYIISERKKYLSNHEMVANSWFWRTQQQQEIDYIEDSDGKICACEFKWNPQAKVHKPTTFAAAYSDSTFNVISAQNYDEFLMPNYGDF
jgi:predicted AAA+ superfamily ATPase